MSVVQPREKTPMMSNDLVPCECGCGGMRTAFDKAGKRLCYISGHNRPPRTRINVPCANCQSNISATPSRLSANKHLFCITLCLGCHTELHSRARRARLLSMRTALLRSLDAAILSDGNVEYLASIRGSSFMSSGGKRLP